MKKLNKVIACALAVALTTAALPVQSFAASAAERPSISALQNINEDNLEKVFTILNNTPEDLLLHGSEAEIQRYLNKQGIYFFDTYEEAQEFLHPNAGAIQTRGVWEGVKCAGAIALFIGGAGAAIKGVQALVKTAGGVKALATAIMAFMRTGVTPEWVTKQPSLSEAFSALGAAILTVTGLDECTKILE